MIPEISVVAEYAGGVGPEPVENRDPAGVAEGKLAVGFVELNSSLGQPVQVGRFYQPVPVGTHIGVQIINEDEEYIFVFGRGGLGWLPGG